jgi:hypothetical protein
VRHDLKRGLDEKLGPLRGRNSRFYRGRIVYLTEELHAYFCDIAMRKGVSLNDVVNDLLSKEVAIVEAMK